MNRDGAMSEGRVGLWISYAGPDRPWAEWAAQTLEAAGHTVELDVWDWAAGDLFADRMNEALKRAERVLSLWSPAYFERERFTTPEWTALISEWKDRGGAVRLIPVRVAAVKPEPILAGLIYQDLFGLNETAARAALLTAVRGPSGRAQTHPFPGSPAVTTTAIAALARESGTRVPGSLPRVWNLPGRNLAFTGRGELLARLREELAAGGRGVVQALNGAGGVGKTQLAIEYGHLFAGEYDLAWWIDAEQPDLIPEQLADLAIRSGWAAADVDVADGVRAAAEQLRQRGRWLLVLDNVSRPDDVRDLLPPGAGHVVITTRHPGFAGLARPVGVQEFTRPESLGLLHQHLPALPEADGHALAEALGDLPLALAQAAGLLAETGMTVSEYRDELTAHARTLLDEGRAGRYPVSLAAAVDLSVSRLADRDPAAVSVLQIACLLAPDPIPVAWFRPADAALLEGFDALVAVTVNAVAFRRTLGRLAEYGLGVLDAGTLQVHRLTQAVIRDTLTPGQQQITRLAAARLLTAAKPPEEDNPESWSAWATYLPHMLALDPTDLPAETPGFGYAAVSAPWYLIRRGQYRAALPAAQRWHTAWSAHDPDSSDAMNMATALAIVYRALGRRREALTLAQDTYDRRRRILGDDHPGTLTSAGNLAIDLRHAGRHEEALTLGQDTYDRSRRILGDDHPDTLTSATNLAIDLSRAGRHEEALILDQDTYDRRRRILGDDHPDTLTSASNLAVDLRNAGRHEEPDFLDRRMPR